jgi:dTDP-4-amino-4,6-dideoxygalactose transaminase
LNGTKCGSLGDFGILSFNGNKIITTSGGGALVCRTEEQAKQTKFYATQARDQAPHYQHSCIGYNYRMSNVCAGIGRGQMVVLEKHIARRKEIHRRYTYRLKDTPGITVMQSPAANHVPNCWLTCILVDAKLAGRSREDIRLKMEANNIETRPLWKPMHLQPVFAGATAYVNGTSEHLFDTGLCLPSSSILTDHDIERVTEIIND